MSERPSTRPPNVVFVMADQLGAASLGCYGSGVESTPTLDRLAAGGVRFDRCYASVAVCAPNRASILTGRSIANHGLTANNLALDLSTPTYGRVLRLAGYRVGGFGKFHQTSMALPLPDDVNELGFDESVPTEDPRLGPWLDWIRVEHPDHYEAALATCWPMPYLSNEERASWQAAYDKHLQPRKQASRWPLMFTSPLPAELCQTTWITDLGIDFMRRHIEEHPDRPFLCHVSYVDPHDPYDPPRPYDAMFLPGDMPDPIEARWPAAGSKALEMKRRFNGFDRISRDPDAIAQLRAYYHGSLRFIDDQIARIAGFLEERGLWDDTIFVFTSDHGEMLGDHELITKGTAHYDKGIRCPLIVCGSGIEVGAESDRLTCSLDFFPTFCDWAGVERRPPLEGKSFSEACSGRDSQAWPEITVESDHCPDVHPSVRSVITDDGWRLSLFDEEPPYGEMFDLREDPLEQRNLFFRPEFVPRKLELLDRFFRAYTRPAQVQQYRNLPEMEGRRHRVVGGFTLVDDVDIRGSTGRDRR